MGGNSSQAMYVNTYIEEQHNYENYENFRAQERLQNPYEDEVATVHSEGVASQAPMVPPRDGDEWVQARMGDIRYNIKLFSFYKYQQFSHHCMSD